MSITIRSVQGLPNAGRSDLWPVWYPDYGPVPEPMPADIRFREREDVFEGIWLVQGRMNTRGPSFHHTEKARAVDRWAEMMDKRREMAMKILAGLRRQVREYNAVTQPWPV